MAYELICQKCGTIGELEDPIDEFECPNCGGTMLPENKTKTVTASAPEVHDDSTPTIAISRSQIQEYRNIKIAKTADLGFGGVVNAKLSASTRGIPVANVATGNMPKIGSKSDKQLIVKSNNTPTPATPPPVIPTSVPAITPAVKPAEPTPAPELVPPPAPVPAPETPKAEETPVPAQETSKFEEPKTEEAAPVSTPKKVFTKSPPANPPTASRTAVSRANAMERPTNPAHAATKASVTPVPGPSAKTAAPKPAGKPGAKPMGKPAAKKPAAPQEPLDPNAPRKRKGTGRFEIDRTGKKVTVFAPDGHELSPSDTAKYLEIHAKKRKMIAGIVIGITVILMAAVCAGILISRSMANDKAKERQEARRIEAAKTPEYIEDFNKFGDRIPKSRKSSEFPQSYAAYTQLTGEMKAYIAKWNANTDPRIKERVKTVTAWLDEIEKYKERSKWGWTDAPKD